jgi:hypothetical protein
MFPFNNNNNDNNNNQQFRMYRNTGVEELEPCTGHDDVGSGCRSCGTLMVCRTFLEEKDKENILVQTKKRQRASTGKELGAKKRKVEDGPAAMDEEEEPQKKTSKQKSLTKKASKKKKKVVKLSLSKKRKKTATSSSGGSNSNKKNKKQKKNKEQDSKNREVKIVLTEIIDKGKLKALKKAGTGYGFVASKLWNSKGMRGSKHRVVYGRKNAEAHAFPGRVYSDGISLQSAPSRVRNLIAGAYYHDLDMVNCAPTIFRGLAAKLNVAVPVVDRVVDDRDNVFAQLYDDLKTDKRSLAKKCICAIFNGGTYVNAIKTFFRAGGRERAGCRPG